MVPDRPITRLAAPAAVFVLIVGVGVAFREPLGAWLRGQGRPPAEVVLGEADLPEDAVERSLALAGVDSTRRNEWVDTVPGIDAAAMSAVQSATFIRFANARRCTCGCGFTPAACRAFDPTCEVSLPIVQALHDSVLRGLVRESSALRAPPQGGR